MYVRWTALKVDFLFFAPLSSGKFPLFWPYFTGIARELFV